MSDQAGQQMSESRFYMWRAIFAMAHVDGRLDEGEEGVMNKYLMRVPFSDEQRAQLEEDMRTPQDIGAMLEKVVVPVDQSEFFYFARMLAYADGDYDQREKGLIERNLEAQMDKYDLDHLRAQIEAFKNEELVRHEADKQKWAQEMTGKVGLSAIIKSIFSFR